MSITTTPLRIGGVELPNRLIAAPMAGISDLPFRELVRRHLRASSASLRCSNLFQTNLSTHVISLEG